MKKLSKEDKEILVRQTLGRIANKWTLVVIEELGDDPIRFSALQKKIGKISQKMLTQTLREMELDGLVERKVYPEVPPRVEYQLTKLGYSLGETVCIIWTWVEKNYSEIQKNRLRKRVINVQEINRADS